MKKPGWVPVASVAFLLLVLAERTTAQVPIRYEQLVYSITAFDGRGYTPTFARQTSETIYLIADADSFVTVRKTFVFFWELTQEWRNEATLDVPFSGNLEIVGRRGERHLVEQTPYTYYNVRGTYELNWRVAVGDEAYRVRGDYEADLYNYYALLERYNSDMTAYNQQVAMLTQRAGELMIREQRISDQPIDQTTNSIAADAELRQMESERQALLAMFEALREPVVPQPPQEYIVPPPTVEHAFVVNLPTGRYSIRFLNPDGTTMVGSEKELVVFTGRREGSTGFDVIPADKWTRPVESRTPAAVLYVSGRTDIYVRPFVQDEFNDLFYSGLMDNNSRGNSSIYRWVRIQQIPGARVEIISGDERLVISEAPYSVEQVPGTRPGYRIVPYEGNDLESPTPDLVAIHIPLDPNAGVIKFRALDRDGTALPGSSRQIRVISRDIPLAPVLLAPGIPLVVMVIVILKRRRSYDR